MSRVANGSVPARKKKSSGLRLKLSTQSPERLAQAFHAQKRSSPVIQRHVFDWYEDNKYKNYDAGEIFSPEWQYRLDEWGKEFDDMTDLQHKVASYESAPRKLDIGLLFQAYPVVAFSLWHVLKACSRLDQIICGTTVQERVKVAGWQKMSPFEYLLSSEIMEEWRKKLLDLSLNFSNVKGSTDYFQWDNLAFDLKTLSRGVQSLEEALSILISIFEGKPEQLEHCRWILELVRESVSDRCRAIDDI